MFLSVACQYFYNVHSDDSNNVTLLSQINKSVLTRASQSNKAYILTSKKSCDNSYLYTAPKYCGTCCLTMSLA